MTPRIALRSGACFGSRGGVGSEWGVVAMVTVYDRHGSGLGLSPQRQLRCTTLPLWGFAQGRPTADR
jgi:hypothetical protein